MQTLFTININSFITYMRKKTDAIHIRDLFLNRA